jgi:hypothetical protein
MQTHSSYMASNRSTLLYGARCGTSRTNALPFAAEISSDHLLPYLLLPKDLDGLEKPANHMIYRLLKITRRQLYDIQLI